MMNIKNPNYNQKDSKNHTNHINHSSDIFKHPQQQRKTNS